MRLKHFLVGIALLFATVVPSEARRPRYATHAEKVIAALHDPHSKYVVVACHRGDWRNYPENSIPAIESIIRMGADIMELDLKMTKDSVLVLCHDKTLDRTTTGKGLVSDHTLAEIKSYRLKRAHGVATDSLRMPTLEEALAVCKDRIVVNVDQGFQYYDKVMAITEKLGMTGQILIKSAIPPEEMHEKMDRYPHKMMFMPIVNFSKGGDKFFEKYLAPGEVPIAFEICWKKMTPEVKANMDRLLSAGSKLWVNTIWGSLCGYLDDDAALASGDPASIYDQVMALGASIIQTDRPEQLIRYLEKHHYRK